MPNIVQLEQSDYNERLGEAQDGMLPYGLIYLHYFSPFYFCSACRHSLLFILTLSNL